MNTTSSSNQNVSILLSSDLLLRMPMNGEYEKIPLGEIQLRGKEEKVALHTVKIK
ncbi:MAG: hypothetical protein ACM339_10010 [Ignavibacteria bacterium]